MTVSLAGIIAVQYFWIRNAIRVKEQQFDQSVSKALSEAAGRLQKDRNISFVSNHVWVQGDETAGLHGKRNPIIWSSHSDSLGAKVIVSGSSANNLKSLSLSSAHEGAIVTVDAFNDKDVRYKTILKLDSIRGELDNDQLYIMTELKDSLDLIVQRKISRVREQNISLNEVIDEMVVELESLDEPLDEAITSELIEKRLGDVLKDEGVDLPYEYGVYNPAEDSLTAIHSELFSLEDDRLYKTRLYPESVFERPELLMVSFPGRSAHIMESMGLLMSGSLLFTLIIIVTFYLTLRIILRQKRLSEIKSDFINNMTHEFKTPIATISLAVDSINNPAVIGDPEKIRYFTGVIGEENTRMNARVENVLQMSLIDSHDFNLHLEETEIDRVIIQAVKNIELQVRQRAGKISFSPEAVHTVIMADKVHLLGVLSNLLENALKYSGEDPEIMVRTKENREQLSISVEDNGIGMSKEEQQRIFDKFYRVPKGDIHNVKGFGLGLSYVKAIVLAMKGEIDVKSQPGKGSVFTLRFPKPVNK